ncbi:MAG: hypothetical protein NC191_00885 [Muribaculaceae bacterium]|nr:hypothetical protein [Muribaculaceae bacterium]
MISKITANNINTYNKVSFGQGQEWEKTLTKKQKAVILASSAAGMAPVLAGLAKHKGFSLNPVKIFKTPIKEWALLKYAPKGKAIEFEAPQILGVAGGSVAGGFVGGCIVDKDNIKAKKREVLNQLLGNVLVPVACVAGGASVYEKYAEKIEGAMPQFKSSKKFLKGLNKVIQKIPNAFTTLGLLAVGIYCGNKVSNLINEKLYHKKVERNIRPSDFAPHVDDVCMATSMMNKESSFGAKLGRIIPIALLVPGYETGIAQSK